MAEKPEVDEFDSAFDDVVAGRNPDAGDTPNEGADGDGDDEGSNRDLEAEDDSGNDDADPGDNQDTGSGGDDTDNGDQEEIDWKAKFEQEAQRNRSWEGRLRALSEENARLKQQAQGGNRRADEGGDGQGRDDDRGTNDDDGGDAGGGEAQQIKERLDEFFEDYPDLKEPLTAMLNQVQDLTLKQVNDRLRPIEEDRQKQTEREHFKAIGEAHEDYRELIDDVYAWVDEQPSYLADGYRRVLGKGGSDEVIDLLDRFKGATGKGKPRSNSGNADDTDHKQRSSRTDRRADDAAAVRHRSGGVPRGRAAADDFDSAFDEAVKLHSK